jgi:putative polyhydroxyalkanoate system protein
MADIKLNKAHKLGLKKAKVAAQKLADQLADDYDLECEWDGDTLCFKRTGLTGSLEVSKDSFDLDVHLGFLLSAFAPKIEEQIKKNLDKFAGSKA